MPRRCVIRLLGGFAVELDGASIPPDAWRHRRGADIVKLVALAPRHRLHREEAMTALWPDLELDAASANLRKAIHFARRALGSSDAITVRSELIELWPSAQVEVDVERFETAARHALGATNHETLEFAGELLPEDRYAEWTEPRRTQLSQLAADVLRRAGRWERILELDRTDEEAHRALMRRALDKGDRQDAIRQFQRLRTILRADLGVSPEPETVALFERAIATNAAAPDVAERAQALIARGLVAWNRRDIDEAERLAEEARRLAQEHHLGRELGEACAVLGITAFAQGRWRERFRQDFDEAIHLEQRESAFVFDAHVCLAETAMGGAEAAAVASDARELATLAERAGSAHGQALARLIIGECELSAGRHLESQSWFSSAVDMFRKAGAESGRALAIVRLAEAKAAAGRGVEAKALLTEARALAERSELIAHLAPRVFAAMIGAATSAQDKERALAEAERRLRPADVCGPCSIGLWVAAAITSAASGDLPRARRFLSDAERLVGIWQGGPWKAAAWEARAFVRLAEGDRRQAEALFLEASSLFAESGRPSHEERCRREAARLG